MEIRPIFSALLRNPVGLILIGLQVALTLAIVVNALYIINQRLAAMQQPAGIDEANVLRITSVGYQQGSDPLAMIRQDLDYLNNRPGVLSASASNTMPMTDSGWSSSVQADRDSKSREVETAIYFADDKSINSLGAKLIAGRNFRPDEIGVYHMNESLRPKVTIVSAKMAMDLFPELSSPEQAIGKMIWQGEDNDRVSAEIIGILDGIKAPWKGWSPGLFEHVAMVPYQWIMGNFGFYIVRAEPGYQADLMQNLEAELAELDPTRVVRSPKAFTEIRSEFYRNDLAMAATLIVVVVLLLLVNALGMVGLVSFWVNQRTKQIGTRRALGATRGNIVRYFLTENLLMTSTGVVLGLVLAMALNNWLVVQFELARLPLYYLAIGAVLLLALGMLAAMAPALRAASIAPAIATRSV